MDEIVHKFLLAGYKFMPEIHLRQAGFPYRACRPFTKKKRTKQKFKACFQQDMAHEGFKELTSF